MIPDPYSLLSIPYSLFPVLSNYDASLIAYKSLPVLHLQCLPVVQEGRAMDSGYYAAMTGLVARTQALDIAATNLANAQTPGYRAEQEYFRSVLMGPDR